MRTSTPQPSPVSADEAKIVARFASRTKRAARTMATRTFFLAC